MLVLWLAVLATPAQDDLPRQWAQFSRSVALRHVTETVDIATGDGTTQAHFAMSCGAPRAG